MKLLLIKSPGILPHPARQQCLAGSPGAGAMSAALRGAGNTLTLGLVAPPAGAGSWEPGLGHDYGKALGSGFPQSRCPCALFPRDLCPLRPTRTQGQWRRAS